MSQFSFKEGISFGVSVKGVFELSCTSCMLKLILSFDITYNTLDEITKLMMSFLYEVLDLIKLCFFDQ